MDHPNIHAVRVHQLGLAVLHCEHGLAKHPRRGLMAGPRLPPAAVAGHWLDWCGECVARTLRRFLGELGGHHRLHLFQPRGAPRSLEALHRRHECGCVLFHRGFGRGLDGERVRRLPQSPGDRDCRHCAVWHHLQRLGHGFAECVSPTSGVFDVCGHRFRLQPVGHQLGVWGLLAGLLAWALSGQKAE
jgi:hypothetical protein